MNEKILIKVNWEESGPTRRKNAHKVDEEGIEEDVYKLRDDGVFMKILEEKGLKRVDRGLLISLGVLNEGYGGLMCYYWA